MFRRRVVVQVRELLRLGVPTMVMRSGSLLMVMADIVMLGRHSSRELAFYSLAQGPLTTLILVGIGLVMGTQVVTARMHGAGQDARCGAVWRRSVPYALALGGAAALLCAAGPKPFLWIGQEPGIAAGAARTMLVLGLGVPFYLGYLASASFLEGLKRPWPGTWMMIGGIGLNIALNAWWIGGGGGVPALGAVGAAWATTVSRFVLCVAAALWVWLMGDAPRFAVRSRGWGDAKSWREQRRLGYAAGASIGVEAVSFSTLNLMAGWFGADALAAYAIGINLLSTVFMVALGMGTAAGVCVGHAWGRRSPRGIALAGWTGLGLNALIESSLVLVFAFGSAAFAGLYSSDPGVLDLASAMIRLIAAILIFDGSQAVMSYALRGRGETWVPTLLQGCAYLLVMLPAARVLSGPLEQGVLGLFQSIGIGTFVSAVLLCLRFRRLGRRDKCARNRGPCRAEAEPPC